MELYVWPGEFGLPSVDIESLQFMAASKFCAAPIIFHPSGRPWRSPSGDLPYLEIEGKEQEQITDFMKFVEFLRNSKQDIVLDSELVPTQLCEFDAYNCLLKQKLRPAISHLFWVDKHNYGAITHPWYSQHLSYFYNIYFVEKRRKRMETLVQVTNKGQQQLTLDAIQALNLLSAKLSDNKYFCGDKPCSLDALIFGYLAPLLHTPLPNDRLQLHLSATPNLVRFVESILSIYLPLSESILREQALSKKMWQRQKLEAQQLVRIEREQRKTERERQKDPLWNTIFFALGCATLAALFSIHIGLVVVKPIDAKKSNGKRKRNT